MESNITYIIGGIFFLIATLSLAWLFVAKKRAKAGPSKKPDEKLMLSKNLQNEQQKSSLILGAIEDGVVLVDASKAIQSFNTAAAKITGWGEDEATGIDYHNVVQLVDIKGQPYPDGSNPFDKAMASKQTIRDNDAVLVSRSAKRVSISLNVTPLIDQSSSNLLGVVGVFRDITQEKEQEKQRSDFISTASHEMRTPIAALDGYLGLALNDKTVTLAESTKNYLEKARSSAQHLGMLFQNLLTSSKAEDGRLSSYPVVTEIGELLQQTTDAAKFNAEKKQLTMDFVVGDQNTLAANTLRPLYYSHVDPDRLREVIQNLLDNAVKYTQEGGVTVSLSGDAQNVVIKISDTGPGIAAEDLPHLFQKFYRVDNSLTRTIGGTGLGLYICKRIVELYNGRVWAESEVGKGSTFAIALPRLSSERAEALKKEEENNPNVIRPDAVINSSNPN